jgi:hypothetical protein
VHPSQECGGVLRTQKGFENCVGHNIEARRGSGLCGKMRYMGIADIFSKREMRASGSKSDVFDYDNIPRELRVQVVCIIRDVVGRNTSNHSVYEAYQLIHDTLAREYGVHQLIEDEVVAPTGLFTFIERTSKTANVLDAIEVSLRIAELAHGNRFYKADAGMSVDDAVNELNQRFLEAGVGYQYEEGEMIPVHSKFTHTEIVKPALVLLSDPLYTGAQEEFLKAHKDFRDRDYKGCLTECGKAFESSMKAICDKRHWTYPQNATASALIDICLKQGLIPSMLQSELNALQTVLESGVPTLRNKLNAAHGQGPVPKVVPPHVAAYALHLTAANIVLLATAEKSVP